MLLHDLLHDLLHELVHLRERPMTAVLTLRKFKTLSPFEILPGNPRDAPIAFPGGILAGPLANVICLGG